MIRGLKVCNVPEPLKPYVLEMEPYEPYTPLGDTAHMCACVLGGQATSHQELDPVSQAMCALACDQAVSRPMILCVFTPLPAISNFSHQH